MEVLPSVLSKTRYGLTTSTSQLHTYEQENKIHSFSDSEGEKGVWFLTFRRLLKSLPYLGIQPFGSCFLVIQFCIVSSSAGSTKIKGRA